MAVEARSKRHYWITGAGSGIGKALVEQLAGAGHRVYVSGRHIDKLESLARNIGGDIIPLPCDVARDDEMKTLLQEYQVQQLDTVIMCAGICEYIDMPDLDVAKIRRVSETNYIGVVNTCIAALPLLRQAASDGRKPHLIGISSMSTYVGFPRAEAYGASKAAMANFLHSLRTDLGKAISVTVVNPGFVETPLTDNNDFPMPFMVSAEQAARIILKKAERYPLTISFPLRMHVLLSAMQFFSRLWYTVLSPRLSRSSRAQS